MGELLERYSAEVLPGKRPHTQATQAHHLAWWQRQLGALRLDQLTCWLRMVRAAAPLPPLA